MAYVIDTYNRWSKWDREHSVYTFTINDNWYAIKEVELEWGFPVLPFRADMDQHPEDYYVYGTYGDALQFVQCMRRN